MAGRATEDAVREGRLSVPQAEAIVAALPPKSPPIRLRAGPISNPTRQNWTIA